MKVGIDSYCYHRYFGEVYPDQKDPGVRWTFPGFRQPGRRTGGGRRFAGVVFFRESGAGLSVGDQGGSGRARHGTRAWPGGIPTDWKRAATKRLGGK